MREELQSRKTKWLIKEAIITIIIIFIPFYCLWKVIEFDLENNYKTDAQSECQKMINEQINFK